MKKLITILLLLNLYLTGHSQDNVFFPPDANVVDVTKAPYFADNTGATDVTAKIQMAMDSAGSKNLIYLPNGTYLVSNTIKWPGKQTRDVLQGQSTAGTIIKLADNALGYGNSAATKAVIWTGTAPAQRFHNSIRNLTVNTGTGNPGATGIQFMANNQGGMEKVTIISGDGAGVYGLDLGYSDEQGPCLMKDIKVVGFQTGIRTKFGVDGVVMSNIILENQTQYGLYNDGQCLSVENLQFTGSVPGVDNRGSGVLAIINSTFTGTGNASSFAAITNSKGMFARNITTTGFLQAINNAPSGIGILTGAANITEFVSHNVLGLFTSIKTSLNLPILPTPEIPLADLSDWVNVKNYTPKDTVLWGSPQKDWTPAIQAAIDAGKSTVYFPAGNKYTFFDTVYVRGNVKRIIGLESEVREYGAANGKLVIADGTSPEVIIEKFDSHYAQWKVIHKSNRVLVLKNIWMDRLTVEAGAGNVFLEDARIDRITTAAGTKVFARQLNMESADNPHLFDNSGTLWILGVKTEDDETVITTKSGGKTELIGGFVYANKAYNINKVMFRNEEGAMFSGTVGEYEIRDQPFHPVEETRDGVTRLLKRGQAYSRGGAGMVPLYTAYRPVAAAVPNGAPSVLSGTVLRYDQIKLTWIDNATNEDGIIIERKVGNGSFMRFDMAYANQLAYNDSTMLPSTTYSYRLQSTNSKGQSAYSNTITLTTLAAPPIPAVPTNLTANINGANINLTWTDNANNEAGFKIERRVLSATDTTLFTQIASLPANTTSFYQVGLAGSQTYEYRIRSYFEISHSDYSSVASGSVVTVSDLRVHWKFEEESGTVAGDASGRSNNGTLKNAYSFPSSSIGVTGKAIAMDGVDDYVQASNSNRYIPSDNYPFTMSAWVKTKQSGVVVFMGDQDRTDIGYYLAVASDGRAKLESMINGVSGNVTGPIINDGNWHLITGVFESAASHKLYIDGTLSATLAGNFTYHRYMTRFDVGAKDLKGSISLRLTGAADDVRLYSKALSQAEITSLYGITIPVMTKVTAVTVSPVSASINVPAAQQLTATVSPSNATDKSITWNSSNTSVATVSSTGLVTGVGQGTATITVRTVDQGKTATSAITVNVTNIPVSGVTLNSSLIGLNVPATYQLNATVAPSNATNTNVTWSSSNTDVATVSSTGLVTATGAGTVIVTVTTADQGKKAICAFTVFSPGMLSITTTPASGNYNLTTEGTMDWAKWGRASVSNFDHKATGGSKISTWTAVSTGQNRHKTDNDTHTWTDGMPTISATANNGMVRTGGGAGKGFEFTVEAGTTPRTVKVYLGNQYNATGLLNVSLDDASVTAQQLNISAADAIATIQFSAGSATKLRIRYTTLNNTGNVFLCAATLQDGLNSAMAGAFSQKLATSNFDSESLLTDNVSIKFYPNPASSELSIALSTAFEAPVSVTIFDLNGRSLISKILNPGNLIYHVDINNLDKGMYIISISNTTGSISERFIKE